VTEDRQQEFQARYKKLLDEESRIRLEACIETDNVLCGYKVAPMSFRHLILYLLSSDPWICGGIPDEFDLARFLWIATDRYKVKDSLRSFLEELQKRGITEKDFTEVSEYVEECLQDSPAGSGEEPGSEYASFGAHVIDRLASQYGWTRAEVVEVPVRLLFQLLAICKHRESGEKPVHISRADKVRGEYLKELNDGIH
jgi:hypothetical protein